MRVVFSDCGKFRHLLWDVWDESKPMLAWCLFNPSVAGQTVNGELIGDPTWRKGRGFSERLGYGGQVFCNPFDFISTDPKGLRAAGYPRSDQADEFILKACAMGDGKVVCAWGVLARGLSRPLAVLSLIRGAGYRPHALGLTSDGLPRHPSRLPYATPLVPMP